MYRAIALALLASSASAHEMTPAYPEIYPSYVEGVQQVQMSLFNARSDVSYFEIKVFDENWAPIAFASEYRILFVPPQTRTDFVVYLRNEDAEKAVYLCSTSKIERSEEIRTLVASRICSRLNGGRP